MKVLCLMGLFPKEYESVINEKSIRGVQNAANKLQWGVVNGLLEQEDVDLHIINSIYLGSYPRRYRDILIPSFDFEYSNAKKGTNVGYLNLTVIKNVSRYLTVKKAVDKWFSENGEENVAVIAYAMTSPFVELLSYIKKKHPAVKSCLIVPDLPEYMNAGAREKKLYSFMKKIQIKHFKKNLRAVDGYVLLTKHMAEWFDWCIRYTVVEGISLKTQKDIGVSTAMRKEQSILYAGLIEEKYGVVDLVEAFLSIDNPEWTLDLFGTGSSVEKINMMIGDKKNVIMHGRVPNSEVLSCQQKAAILVNPRNDQHDFTKYSFPSKIIEYMGSGTPMIGYRLSGMPEDYLSHFYVVAPQSGGLKSCLEYVMSLSEVERQEKGEEALRFIANEKNPRKQTDKIMELIRDL